MYTIINQFEAYLSAHKKVSASTYRAYIKDVTEFTDFLIYHNRDLDHITEQEFIDFFSFLKKRRTSLATGMRKASALKIFACFMHKQLQIPDYSSSIVVYTRFPLLCNIEKITQILRHYQQINHELIDYKSLRKYIILYLLSHIRLTIGQLVGLHTYDICYQTSVLRLITPAKDRKELVLTHDFCQLIKHYISLSPYQSAYLFPVKLGTAIRPISQQAIWSFLRSLFNHVPTTIFKSSEQNNSLVQQLYKQKHPRS